MTAIHLHFKSNVGTTYKRALTRFYRVRDQMIPRSFEALAMLAKHDNWSVLTMQKEDARCANPVTLIRR